MPAPNDSEFPAADNRVINACPECGRLLDVTDHDPYSKIECPACRNLIRVRADFNHFRIIRQIGEGGMSRVFLAEDVALGREDALKILNRQFSEDAKRTEQFEREATITASISHPNVVRVYSVGNDQGYFYIAMEVVGNGSLDDLIRQVRKVDEDRVIQIALEVAAGLRAAQRAGLIHRDVKPGNILFADDGTAKIVDFGLALVLAHGDADDGEIWATPYYVPPEKLDGKPDDFRGDLYSLGATLFHALAGEPPFAADTASIAELRRLKHAPTSLAAVAPHVSPETCLLIDKAMALDPGERHASYDELINHLHYARKCLRRGGSRLARTLGGPGAKSSPVAPLLWGGGIAALVVVGVLVAIERGSRTSGGGDDPVLGESPIEIRSGGVSTAKRFLDARAALLGDRTMDALRDFRAIANAADTRQPTLDWARFNGGLCLLLAGKEEAAREMFRFMHQSGPFTTEGTEAALAEFFVEIGRLMDSALPVDVAVVPDYPADSVRSVGLLVFGLKNWLLGDPGSARVLLEGFLQAAPPESVRWIGDYRKLAEPYLHDARLLADLPAFEPDSGYPEAAAILEKAELAASALRLDSGPSARLRSELDSFRSKVASIKKVHDREQLEKMSAVAQAEREALGAVVREIDPRRRSRTFAAGSAALAEAAERFETPEWRQAADDLRRLWEMAASFVERLEGDLASGRYEGEIHRGTAAPFLARVTGFADGVMSARTTDGRTVEVPLSEVSDPGMLAMARRLQEGVSDSDAFYARWEEAVAFAKVSGLEEAAETEARRLARENRAFRERWRRIAAINL